MKSHLRLATFVAALSISSTSPADERAEVRRTYDRLHGLVSAGEFEKASALMTKEAAAELAGEYLLLVVELSMEKPKDRDLRRLSSKCRRLVRRHELAGIVPDAYFGDGEFTAEEFDVLVAKALEGLVRTVDAKASRFVAMGDLHAAVAKLPREDALDYLPYFADDEIADVTIDGTTASLKTRNAFEPEFLTFEKVEGEWRWSGFDWDRYDAEMNAPFPLVEDLEIAGTTADGKSVKLSNLRGKVVLIDFWGTWCTPCVAELPPLKRLHAILHEKGFAIVGVAVDDRETLAAFLEKRPLPWANIVDGERGRNATRLGVDAFPTTLLVDRKGQHVASDLHGLELFSEIARQLELEPDETRRLRQTLEIEQHEDGRGSRGRDTAPNDSDEGGDR